MLDYRLEVFRAVAERLNFTRAAAALHISQPAVTRHIKHLENHYGSPLFLRGPAGISLTDAGRVLLDHARQLDGLTRAMETRLRSRQPLLSGPLRLAASTTIGQYLLPPLLAAFHKKHPAIRITLRTGNTEEVVGAMLASRADLGLIEGSSGQRELHTEAFFEDEILCVAAPDHPLAKRPRVTLADLRDEPVILREPGSGTRRVVEQALQKAGLPPRQLAVAFEIQDSETIKGLVAHRAGLGFLSRLIIRHELAQARLVALPVKGLRITRPFYFLTPQGPPLGGAAGGFMAFLRESTSAA
ncbi:MAG: LysR family transcriptional regulator [Opitutaceae bacterium]|jgi:DNA-binding transcriptional LysR family regulator